MRSWKIFIIFKKNCIGKIIVIGNYIVLKQDILKLYDKRCFFKKFQF